MSQEIIFKERLGDYWYCENVDTWVPVGVNEIKSLDQVNNYFILTLNCDQHKQSVAQTLLRGKEKELTVEEYHEKFCEFKEGKWIWKSINEINTSIKLALTTSVKNSDNLKISEFEKIMSNIDLVYDFYIYKFDNKNNFYKIIFNGSPDYFLKIMKNNNYEFDIQNQIWILK